jgi:hypothetical protein
MSKPKFAPEVLRAIVRWLAEIATEDFLEEERRKVIAPSQPGAPADSGRSGDAGSASPSSIGA